MRVFAQGMAAWGVVRLLAALAIAFASAIPAHAQDALCAQVKIEIKQKLSLERQAFDAMMRITNGLDTSAISGIGINLTFEDDAGNPVVATTDPTNTSAAFFLRVDSMTGIGAVDGSGSIDPKSVGEIHWLIIPAQGTGGVQPQGRMYYVGASLTYTVLGTTSTISVTPDFITVKPQPLLALDYFLAGDVYADDPFTQAVEPAEPFTLGVRIRNEGGGTAAKTTIESAQPKIVENTQGLVIGFQIQDSYVNDKPAAKTLLIDFGDIGPGASAVGRWNMVTTLSGKFTELSATYTHADSLGGALTSLIKGISTHLLVHDVKADLPGRDAVRDFLALDGDVLRLYESEGVDTAVIDQSTNARLVTAANGGYDLTFPPTTGFVYVKLADPQGGKAQPAAVVRSDGKVVPVENVWLSKSRGAKLGWNYYVNFFDVNSTGSYSVRFNVDANDNGLREADEAGLGVTAVTLRGTDDQGRSVEQTAYAAADGSWSFQQRPGTYSLEVAAVSGYADGRSKAGLAGGTVAGATITGIVLAANVEAPGYLFAKVKSSVPAQEADVSVTLSASAVAVAAGGEVTLTIVASNAGPAVATSTRVTDLLPSTLSLVSAATSAGGYSSATGVWSVGTLGVGASATLKLVVKVLSTAQPIVDTATIVSALTDSATQNNSASVTINPEAGTLGVTQAIPREARVLAFVGCPGTSAQANPSCTSARAGFLAGYLGGMGYDTKVVTAADAFVAALRSGRYNTYWLSADDALGTLPMSELREAVLRGDTLVFDGPDGTGSAPLDDATGATATKDSVGTNAAIDVVNGASGVATVGVDRKLVARGGKTLAKFAGKSVDPAIVALAYGKGYGLVTAFDLVGTLQVAPSEIALRAIVTDLLTTRAPAVPAAFVGNAYVPMVTAVENLAAAATVEVTTTLPGGMSMADANPAPTSAAGNDITWRFGLAPHATQFIDLGVRVPLASSTYAVGTTVSKIQGATSTPFNAYSLAMPVAAADRFGPQLIADLGALTLALPADRTARDAAVAALTVARGAIAANDFDTAFAKLVSASEALVPLTGVAPEPYRVTASKWLQEAEQRWYLGLPSCGMATDGPQAIAGTSFAAFDAADGLEARGGRAAKGTDWAWSLGANRQATTSAQQSLDWITGKTYAFSLTYDGAGAGSYTVRDGATTLFTRSYAGAAGKLDAGDTLRIVASAKAEAAAGRLDVNVQSINGKPVGLGVAAAGTSPGSASLYLYYPAMASGFELSGTIRITASADALLADRLDFTVTAGRSVCRAP